MNGGYTQADVTTSRRCSPAGRSAANGPLAGGETGRFYFREGLHEPGAKPCSATPTRGGVRQGEAVLTDLARQSRPRASSRPSWCATSWRMSRRRRRSPTARAYLTSGGDLPRVYAALVEFAGSLASDARKFKTPEDFVFSALRALHMSTPQRADEVVRSFELLGQRQYTPGSPAGWPDTSRAGTGRTRSCTAYCGPRAWPPAPKGGTPQDLAPT